jgi:hypothetical protein
VWIGIGAYVGPRERSLLEVVASIDGCVLFTEEELVASERK